MEVKVRQYSLRPNSPNGYMVSLPVEWVQDLNLKPGEKLDIYRDDRDAIIIRPQKR